MCVINYEKKIDKMYAAIDYKRPNLSLTGRCDVELLNHRRIAQGGNREGAEYSNE